MLCELLLKSINLSYDKFSSYTVMNMRAMLQTKKIRYLLAKLFFSCFFSLFLSYQFSSCFIFIAAQTKQS